MSDDTEDIRPEPVFPEYMQAPAPYHSPMPQEHTPPRARLSWAVWILVILTALLVLPTLAEQVEYSITRGREQAQAEVARAQLESGHAVTLGDYRYVAKAIQPSVVGVKASRIVGQQETDEMSFPFGQHPRFREQDQGSGVIVDTAGYIITNNHVVDSSTDVTVQLSDGSRPKKATVVGVDPLTDVAVLKISGTKLTAAPWGDSDAMEPGDPVMAAGNPFGLAKTVTVGIISAKSRHDVTIERVTYQDFLQTDAAVNPGNSGGPLVNMKGEVIGINTAIVGPTYQGISFAIPSNLVKRVYEQLREKGKVARGWLGVSMQELTPELSDRLKLKSEVGVLVAGIVHGSPAEEANIRRGDIITKWNDKAITNRTELSMEVAWTKIGDKATVTIVRDGNVKTIEVTVGERPEQIR